MVATIILGAIVASFVFMFAFVLIFIAALGDFD
jgi:hypothetical protein